MIQAFAGSRGTTINIYLHSAGDVLAAPLRGLYRCNTMYFNLPLLLWFWNYPRILVLLYSRIWYSVFTSTRLLFKSFLLWTGFVMGARVRVCIPRQVSVTPSQPSCGIISPLCPKDNCLLRYLAILILMRWRESEGSALEEDEKIYMKNWMIGSKLHSHWRSLEPQRWNEEEDLEKEEVLEKIREGC